MTTDKSSVAPQPDPFQEAFRRRFSEHLAADVAGGKAALDTAQKAGREFGGVELHPERLGAFGDALAERAPQLARDFGLRRDQPPMPAAIDATPPWAVAAQLRLAKSYAVPNGRRYALFESAEAPPGR